MATKFLLSGDKEPASTLGSPEEFVKAASGRDRNDEEEIVALTFAAKRIVDSDLAYVKDLGSLELLVIQDCPELTGGMLKHIAESSSLKTLEISGIRTTDADLEVLGKLNTLTSLSLYRTGITGSGLGALAQLPLKELRLSGPQLTVDGLGSLADFKTLEKLAIGSNRLPISNITSLSSLTLLRELNSRPSKVSNEAVKMLTPLVNLEKFEFESKDLTDEALDHFATMPNLAELNLVDAVLTNDAIARLITMPSLRSLTLPKSISDAGVEKLAASDSIEHINCWTAPATGICIAAFTDHARIKRFEFRDDHLTPEGRAAINEFQKNRPDVEIKIWVIPK